MPDMLVKLYDLPEFDSAYLEKQGITIRAANPWEKTMVLDWVAKNFSVSWADELSQSFTKLPGSNLIAVRDGKILGFACYDCSRKGFFGPTAVAETERKKGIGKALLLMTLHRMFEDGYAYAVIGAAGPTEFYKDAVGAIEIDGSVPGIYQNSLNNDC